MFNSFPGINDNFLYYLIQSTECLIFFASFTVKQMKHLAEAFTPSRQMESGERGNTPPTTQGLRVLDWATIISFRSWNFSKSGEPLGWHGLLGGGLI
jgi:hypothetical protein